MKDPYKVLGISPHATNEEVKSAYRELAKKYHPDNYANSPIADVAEEKMKEINEAYDEILKIRAGKGEGSHSGNTYNGGSYGSSNNDPYFAEVRQNINNGRIKDAESFLNSTPSEKRNASISSSSVSIPLMIYSFSAAAFNKFMFPPKYIR